MTIAEALTKTSAELEAAGVPDAAADAGWLLARVTGVQALMLRFTERQMTADESAELERLCAQRRERVPLQYVLHDQPFLGRSFYVDERVLIPRPETELLAERAIEALRTCGKTHPTVLDLCCGSGCLAVSMALNVPTAAVEAADLSADALAVTKKNRDALHARVTLHQGDLLDAVGDARYDVIVSNPPYIPAEDCKALQAEVRREPHMALDGGADGLDFYRRIASDAPKHLEDGGRLLLEVGFDQAERVAALLRETMTDVRTHKDYQGILRMVEATKK